MSTKFYHRMFITIFLWFTATGLAVASEPWKTGYFKGLPVVMVDDEGFNGFVACYARDNGVIGVTGYVAMQGQYVARFFNPLGYMNIDISPVNTAPSILCQNYIPNCIGTECWAGGDTGGLYGGLLSSLRF